MHHVFIARKSIPIQIEPQAKHTFPVNVVNVIHLQICLWKNI